MILHSLLTVALCVWVFYLVAFTPVGRDIKRHPGFPLLAVCLAVVLFNCACGSTDAFFAVAQAIIATVGIVLKALSSVLTPAEETEAQALVGTVASDMKLVQTDVNAYEANKTGTGLLATLQAGIATLQGSLGQLEAAAGIKNQVLLNWIAAIVSAVGAAITEIATVIVPLVPAAFAAHLAGDDTKMESIGDQLKVITVTLKDAHHAAADKVLDPETAKAVKAHVDHAAAPHFGPIRI